MSKPPKDTQPADKPSSDRSPRQKQSKPPPNPERAAREAAALRANLLKRKDQTRQREQAQGEQTKLKPDQSPDNAAESKTPGS
jgi:hypothetical protein